MRWYDYVACVWFADAISAGLLNFHIIPLTMGIISYMIYENIRKQSVEE